MVKTPLQIHMDRWNACQRCELHKRRDRTVQIRGSVPCEILFVGEAPGASENVLGRPFVGPAGRLLDAIIQLAAEGRTFAMTNLVACIPLDLSFDKISEPSDQCVQACQPRLRELLALCKPKLIVAVGKLSAKWLPKLAGVGETVPMVEIVHPAAILRANVAAQGLMRQRAVVTLTEAVESIVR